VRVYICADIEGVAGVVSFQHLSPEGFEYQRAREWMTGEVAAAIAGARAGGATEIVVSDSHGNGQNLLLEKLPDDVTVVRSWPRPLEMMQGIEEGTFGAVLMVGHHAGHSDMDGSIAHTFTGAIMEVRLNGEPASETRLNAALSGHFGVPVTLVTGDEAYVRGAHDLLGDVEAVTTKWGYTDYCARTIMPAKSQALIRAAAEAGIRRAASLQPYRVSAPITLDIVFKQRMPAEVLAMLSIVERTAATAIRVNFRDMVEAMRFIVFVTNYNQNLR
jgi:D-amino peptidase